MRESASRFIPKGPTRADANARVQGRRRLYRLYIYIYMTFSTFGKDVAYRKGRRRLIVIINATNARPPKEKRPMFSTHGPVAHLINISNVPYFVYI